MRFAGFVFVCLLLASLFFLPGVSSQEISSENNSEQKKTEDSLVAVRAEKRGFPRVNFADGRDLSFAGKAQQNAGSAKLLTSADFDSDGTADLMTADFGGSVKFYRGNADSIYPNSVEAQARRANGNFSEEAFLESEKSFQIPVSPDFLAAGDFNADGHQDILAAQRNASALYLLAGDGAGNFAPSFQITLDGSITAFAVGEIGQRNGQTDVVVALSGKGGNRLAVFEHPEGAFKNKPEIIKLPSAANDLAIGHLDTDYFGDIAVSGGNLLTVVRGRGQIYPWDLMPEYDLKRPAPIVETRNLPFQIAALATGYFTEKRGESLALLTTGGSIEILDSPRAENKRASLKPENLKNTGQRLPLKESSKRLSKFKTFAETLAPGDTLRKIKEINEPAKPELTERQREALLAGNRNLSPESSRRAKENFLRAISPAAAAPLALWKLETIAFDSRLAGAANSFSRSNLVKVRVSDSGRDELAFIDAGAKQIHLMIRENLKRNRAANANEIISLDVESAPLAILPMRLNVDALSDLVVLRENSSTPSVVMTAPSATFVVNSTADDADCGSISCTLRGAIESANANPGPDMITFAVGGGLIQPETALPQIDFAVTIDGTNPGYAGQPGIDIKGNLVEEGHNGLSINAADVVVRGLAINEFRSMETPSDEGAGIGSGDTGQTGGSGIAIYNFEDETHAGFCIIEGNYLGTDITGSIDLGNDQAGLFIYDADNNTVGGTTGAARNLLSGNGDGELAYGEDFGYGLYVVDGRLNEITGNYVGTAANGSSRIGNSTGMFLSGMDNLIGTDSPNSGNVVSGNTHKSPSNFDPQGCFGMGIAEGSIININTGEWSTAGNSYKSNRIGVTAAGNAALNNCRTGLFTSPRNTASIGSITETGRNTISGNTDGGLFCSPFGRGFGNLLTGNNLGVNIPEGFCQITGNNVGTDVTGNFAIPNDHRHGDQIVAYFGALIVYNTETFSTVGGRAGTSANSCTGHCNLVSGNGSAVYSNLPGMAREGNLGNVGIWKNFVGTNKAGSAAVANTGSGISAHGGNTSIGSVGSSSGGDFSLGNLISGNQSGGVNANPSSEDGLHIMQIIGNLIGTDASGVNAIPNNTTNPTGVALSFFNDGVVIVGDTHPLARNIISGNYGTGIVFGPGILSTATVNNYIGVNKNGAPLGNSRNGVELWGTFDYLGNNGVGNVIANNGLNGVYVNGRTGVGNRIRFNSIYNNGALGIDLTADTTIPIQPDGVTPNDCDDADTGANDLQNFPLLYSPTFEGNTMTVSGILQSQAGKTYALDFYASAAADPSGYGEGQTFLGSKNVTIAANSNAAPFIFTFTGSVTPGMKITATATDNNGNTSEFSCVAGQCENLLAGFSKDGKGENLGSTPCGSPIVVNVSDDRPNWSETSGTCEVDVNNPAEECSLRAALVAAKNRSGFDWIQFAIPGNAPHIISLTQALPEITHPVYIDGLTQSPVVSLTPRIEVRGGGAIAQGFVFAPGSDGSGFFGMAVNGFATDVLVKSPNNIIENCFFGLSADGSAAGNITQHGYGVAVFDSQGTRIGKNTISNNLVGVSIQGSSAGTKILENKIGTNRTGSATIENRVGIALGNTSSATEVSKNVVSGNSISGILITDTSTQNRILTNTIGVNQAEDAALGNHTGIRITAAATVNEVKENVISGNTENGVLIDQSANQNHIFNNKIGVNWAETRTFGNKLGIDIKNNSEKNDIFGNTISGNTVAGITIHEMANENHIHYNQIGTNSAGTAQIRNDYGISIFGEANTNVIDHNTISGNMNAGIYLTGAAIDNSILDNQIGTNAAGTERISNNDGVKIDNVATVTQIKRNTISGNINAGVLISGNVVETLIQDNKIGTNKAGNGAISLKQKFGIHITSGIGNNFQIIGNTISNHSETGILMDGASETNVIADNGIGTNFDRNDSLPNENGIVIKGTVTDMEIRENTISGNAATGLLLSGQASHIGVFGNKFGTNKNGDAKIDYVGDDMTNFGIQISGSASSNEIHDNLISNHDTGILIGTINNPATDGVANLNYVYANTVGLNFAKTAAIPNNIGIAVRRNAFNNVIGSTASGSGNTVSGNRDFGIFLGIRALVNLPPESEFPNQNKFFGNFVGLGLTTAGQTRTFPNKVGIGIENAVNNTIGGGYRPQQNFMAANIIVASLEDAIRLGAGAKTNSILKNYTGALPPGFTFFQNSKSVVKRAGGENYGNAGNGIFITDGAGGNTIGGATPEDGLVVADNGGNGISLSPTAGNGNRFGANSIFNNAGIGIDLGGNGFTPNDPQDADTGPNNLQNYPEIVSKQIVDDELIIGFKVDSAPANSDYGASGIYVEFFKADSFGEGEMFLGSGFYAASDYNNGSPQTKTVNLGNLAALGITASDRVTATATDAAGNSSEFTPTFAPTAANVSVSGRILSANGAGIAKARISLVGANGETRTVISNSFGYYEFTGVEVGQIYVVSAQHKIYRFDPPTQVVTVMDELTDVDFTASP